MLVDEGHDDRLPVKVVGRAVKFTTVGGPYVVEGVADRADLIEK